jgi:hypothetical protein
MNEAIRDLLCSKVLYGICPKDITHEAVGWGFAKAIDLHGEKWDQN